MIMMNKMGEQLLNVPRPAAFNDTRSSFQKQAGETARSGKSGKSAFQHQKNVSERLSKSKYAPAPGGPGSQTKHE